MQVKSYSPSCEAYAECGRNREVYDLSPDIVSMTVLRNSDEVSTFSIKLQNKNWKYNGLFTPMDRIVLYCTKDERVKLLSGFITECGVYSLYQGDLTIKGVCTMYKVKKFFWDPGLIESQQLLQKAYTTNTEWGGMGETITDLLVKVGGWDEESILIGDIPRDAMDYAYDMYQANLDSANQLKSMVDEFYNILRTHGPKLSAGAAASSGAMGSLGSGSGDAVWNLYISWEGQFDYSQAGGRLDPLNSGYSDCSASIYVAYQMATGIDVGTWTGEMEEKGVLVADGSGELPIDKMAVGDLILVQHFGSSQIGHVELYGPNNQYAGHGGPGKGPTIKQDARAYGTTQQYWQIRRYVEDVKDNSKTSSSGRSGGSGGLSR